MINVDHDISAADLAPAIETMWNLSAAKILAIDAAFPPGSPTPVVTREGLYQPQGWTEWTQGFQHGSAVLQFDATGDERFLDLARRRTRETMASHVTHVGVHDHGFNNVSTYGNLLRVALAGRCDATPGELDFYRMALMASGAVQAARWASRRDPGRPGAGYIYSFNGPQSLFVDTIRSGRSLVLAHLLGHALMGEQDEKISLYGRFVEHARSTAEFNIYYGEGRDIYDLRGRTCHEALFNAKNGDFRAPSTQQGYSPFSTWTRGLAWAICGFAEQLECLPLIDDADLEPHGGRDAVAGFMIRAARATADFYIERSPTCGVPYWDTGAPGLVHMGDVNARPAEPFNDHEPVDSSAAAIAAQGLLRLGSGGFVDRSDADRYTQAGLTIARTLLSDAYTSRDPDHQGLLLHTVYHRPRGWDHIPEGRAIPCGESCMWGDYHLRELALMIQRAAEGATIPAFFHAAVPDGFRAGGAS
ncbi:MAG: glycoside hydrolase family 88 protein [Phycisphaeraceae bacterium]|nr:MAG: glycoside hydrolase family 88 protein [Phycisphaeraceae bacterium]